MSIIQDLVHDYQTKMSDSHAPLLYLVEIDTTMEYDYQTRPSSHGEPLYEVPSLSFTNLEESWTFWRVKCKKYLEFGCGWKLHACKRSTHGLFEITQYNGPHSCLLSELSQDHPHIDASLIANEVQHLVKEQPSITVLALRAKIMKILNYTISYKKVWKGKQKAIEQVFGDWD